MTLALTPSSAAFFGVVIGSFLYGLFFLLAILSTVLHIQRIKRNHSENAGGSRGVMRSVLRNPMILAGFAMFLTVTARWVLDIVDTAYGLLESEDSELYFSTPVGPTAVAGMAFFIASLVICDTMIVYRLWSIWNNSTMVAIFPFFSLLGMLACGIGFTYQMATMTPGDSVFAAQIRRWVVTDSVLNLVTNVYCTAFIAYRIRVVNSVPTLARLNGRKDLKSIIAILIESAALLSTCITLGILTYPTKSPLEGFSRPRLGSESSDGAGLHHSDLPAHGGSYGYACE
ncbi:hypothetical protein C8R45DRAFT_213168 [Mycena sanguinolenta]|nr:hypothetical protein C8R45DRAFT_213168 [Mycena sanguinolenta]